MHRVGDSLDGRCLGDILEEWIHIEKVLVRDLCDVVIPKIADIEEYLLGQDTKIMFTPELFIFFKDFHSPDKWFHPCGQHFSQRSQKEFPPVPPDQVLLLENFYLGKHPRRGYIQVLFYSIPFQRSAL